MSALLVTVMEAAYVGFALLARKLILCSELIAVVGMVGWSLDAHLGLSLWPPRRVGRSRASAVIAAATTLLLVLFVAFVRDFSELGPNPSFVRYGCMCLGVMAAITVGGAVGTRGRRGKTDVIGLVALWGIAAVGIVCLELGVQLCSSLLVPIGHLFRIDGPECAYHGLATVLTVGGALALGLRLLRTEWRLKSLRLGDVFLVFAFLALAQGFLAYRGVSAIYVLAVPAALGWRAGWRLHLASGEGSFLARVSRAPHSAPASIGLNAQVLLQRTDAFASPEHAGSGAVARAAQRLRKLRLGL